MRKSSEPQNPKKPLLAGPVEDEFATGISRKAPTQEVVVGAVIPMVWAEALGAQAYSVNAVPKLAPVETANVYARGVGVGVGGVAESE